MQASLADSPTFTARLDSIRARIARAQAKAGRASGSVTLVAVSKKQSSERIDEARNAGLRVFGESRVQESQARWGKRADRHATGIAVRLIGPLQTNKARAAVETFDLIESLDRPRLARALAEAGAMGGFVPPVFVQVNTGEEADKSGIHPDQTDAFIDEARTSFGLDVQGLMCLPPYGQAPGPHFALLADIAARNGLTGLSMGMSADFETAIALGATSVRIGTALFGPRPAATAATLAQSDLHHGVGPGE